MWVKVQFVLTLVFTFLGEKKKKKVALLKENTRLGTATPAAWGRLCCSWLVSKWHPKWGGPGPGLGAPGTSAMQTVTASL